MQMRHESAVYSNIKLIIRGRRNATASFLLFLAEPGMIII